MGYVESLAQSLDILTRRVPFRSIRHDNNYNDDNNDDDDDDSFIDDDGRCTCTTNPIE